MHQGLKKEGCVRHVMHNENLRTLRYIVSGGIPKGTVIPTLAARVSPPNPPSCFLPQLRTPHAQTSFFSSSIPPQVTMSRGAKHRNAFDIFAFSTDDPPCPKPRLSIRPSRLLSVRMPSSVKGKLTTAERLKMAKNLNSQRLTQSIRRQKREREKAEKEKQEAYRRVLVRRKEDPNLVWDLTKDAPVTSQPTQPSQPDELVSDDDEDDRDFIQPIQPRKLFTSPELVKHVSRRPETSPLRHSATTHVTEVSDDEENISTRSRLKKRRVDQPQKRIGLPVNSAVFAPSVRNAISRTHREQKTSARSVPTIPRAPLATVNGSRKASQHVSKTSGSSQDANVQRQRTHSRSEFKTDHNNTSSTREMVLHISSILPSDDEDIQEIHQISDDDFAPSHRELKKQKDSVRGNSVSDKVSRQALKRPRHRRELHTAIPAQTFYGKNKEPKANCIRRRNRVLVPLVKGQEAKVPSKEIARLSLEEQESNPRSGLRDINAEKANRRHVKGRIQYESSEEDDEPTDSERDIRFKPLSRSELETVRSLTFKVSKAQIMAKIPEAKIELKAGDFSGLRGSRWLNDEILNSFVSLINARNRLQLGPSSKENSAPVVVKKDDDDDDDEIMEVAVTSAKPMEVFRRPRPQSHVFNTFFFSRLSQHGYDYNGVRRWLKKAGRDIRNLDLIMFPINLSNFHWVLAAIDLRGKQFLYLDSTYGEDSSGAIPLLRKWLHDEVADKHGESAAADMHIDSWGSIVNPSYLPRQRDGGSCGIFTLYMAEYLERGKRPDFKQENIRTLRQRTALFLKQGKLPDC